MTKATTTLKLMVDALARLEDESAHQLDDDFYDLEIAELSICEAVRSYVKQHRSELCDEKSQRRIAYAFEVAQSVGIWHI